MDERARERKRGIDPSHSRSRRHGSHSRNLHSFRSSSISSPYAILRGVCCVCFPAARQSPADLPSPAQLLTLSVFLAFRERERERERERAAAAAPAAEKSTSSQSILTSYPNQSYPFIHLATVVLMLLSGSPDDGGGDGTVRGQKSRLTFDQFRFRIVSYGIVSYGIASHRATRVTRPSPKSQIHYNPK
mmetsp:Transcript_25919/g.61503  ORF Transcript_25919/g.61503 Transcript_25919/m.61503 type:complete len:189 (+) Transcript_25919:390-956(+)